MRPTWGVQSLTNSAVGCSTPTERDDVVCHDAIVTQGAEQPQRKVLVK
ncbi:MAG TPA: hypothetical protein VGQ10_06150 [Vicinamibacterales bacterium]|nr:hypothetical protein [Vicinamibacterales bacterium]